ncbi:hypothetical protein F4823DRAFT_194938 [Ustulina deusta]|nr:hypothetical protein F4823DRAFT_194938 [Ustulina deusta]
MVNSSETPKPEPDPEVEPEPIDDRSNRFGRFEIWRTEVAASHKYCACSAPTTRDKASRFGAFYRRSVAKFGIDNPLTDQEECPSSPQTAESSRSPHPLKSHPPESPGDLCAVCKLPTDGVRYKSLSKDGYGLVRARSPSPQPVSGNKCLDEDGNIKGKGKSVLNRMSQVFHRTKALDSQPQSIELIDMSKKTGTEMYSDLRPGAADDGKHDETSSAMSDEDRKKPKTGIEGSAARLRRAQNLLHRRPQP